MTRSGWVSPKYARAAEAEVVLADEHAATMLGLATTGAYAEADRAILDAADSVRRREHLDAVAEVLARAGGRIERLAASVKALEAATHGVEL